MKLKTPRTRAADPAAAAAAATGAAAATPAGPIPGPSTGSSTPRPRPQRGESYDGPERRRSPRHPQFAPATLQPASGDASVDRQVMAVDLSLTGVGFRAAYPFKAGTIYRITLSGPACLNARIRIVGCRARPDGTYHVGGEFV